LIISCIFELYLQKYITSRERLGLGRFRLFEKMIDAAALKDFDQAAAEMKDPTGMGGLLI